VIRNEHQFMITRQQAGKFEEAMLRLKQRPVQEMTDMSLAELQLDAFESQLRDLYDQMSEYDRRVNGDRQGTWFPLYSGRRFWPLDPRPQDIDIRDIAHSLARLNRFNGHTTYSYSVAQHSVLVSRLLPSPFKLFGLMHDAGECYLGDVITPIKMLIRDFYEPVEEKVMLAVAWKYGFESAFVDPVARLAVKQADTVMLATEARDLTTWGVLRRALTELPLDQPIGECWDAHRAEANFIEEFNLLYAGPTKRQIAV